MRKRIGKIALLLMVAVLFSGVAGCTSVPGTTMEPMLTPTPTLSPTHSPSPSPTPIIPILKTTPSPVPTQPINPNSDNIAYDYLYEMNPSIQLVPNSGASVEILLPNDFDAVVGDEEIGELLQQRNELSKQHNLDFSQYMGQEVYMHTVMVDDSTGYLLAMIFVAESKVVGYWNDPNTNADTLDFHVLMRSLMFTLGKHEIHMTSGESILYPFEHRIFKYFNGQIEEWNRIQPVELPSELSTLYLASDTEIVRSPGEKIGDAAYTLYDDQYNIVYEDSKFFKKPTSGGGYTLCYEMNWGTENHYETFQYFFKIHKIGD